MAQQKLVSQKEDFSKWYTDVILQAGLADYSPVKGCMVIKPYGYALWENIQMELNNRIKAAGVKNAYFPLFIPKSYIDREAEHVEGFAPELATVTHVGNEKLDEPLVIRPTSETIMYATFKDWIHSYRDLPLLINQWANVVRMEKRTRLFLRTTEFLWQEGHTCHATSDEAEQETMRAIGMYDEFYSACLAIPGYIGKKSEGEKFPGAVYTTTVEAMAKDGKAIQGCTSHFLGQGFAKSIGIEFQNVDNELAYVWQTSWGLTTRVIGALVVVHGDDKGLQLPPVIAPTQVVIVPIAKTDEEKVQVSSIADEIKRALPNVRIEIDSRDYLSPGAKFYDWELKGVPVRIEIGPRDFAASQVIAARRDTSEKETIPMSGIVERIPALLREIQKSMFAKALTFRDEHTFKVETYEEFKKIIDAEAGFAHAHWCESVECEAKIKEETKATTRCRVFDEPEEKGSCIYCGKESTRRIFFAKAY